MLLEARRAKSTGARLKALAKVRPGHLVPDIPRNAEPRTGLSMGEHAAVTARAWGITREAQDELAATSHQRLAAAYERGLFQDLVVPFRGLARDQNLRPGSTVEKLAALEPVFGLGHPGPTMTAGNSTPLTDGAALVLLAIRRYQPPRVVVARMVTNVLLDSLLGTIPFVGDLFDLGYRASSKNMRLLQGVSERRRRGEEVPTAGSIGFLVAVALILVGGLALTILGAVTLIAWLLGRPLF